jgi:hypothetical protein
MEISSKSTRLLRTPHPCVCCVVSSGGEVLLVSQFTLYAKLLKQNRPDFHKALPPDPAKAFYHGLLEHVRSQYQAEKIKVRFLRMMMRMMTQPAGTRTSIVLALESRPSLILHQPDRSPAFSTGWRLRGLHGREPRE